jgi:Fe-S oxidoreductase
MCHFACPVAEAEKNEAVTPWGKQQTAKLIDQGTLPLNEENALSAYQCVTCRASESFCEHQIVVADSLHELREKAVAADVAPSEVLNFEKHFRKHNNPYGIDLQDKIRRNLPGYTFQKGSSLFFPTCHLTALAPRALRDSLEILEKLRIEDLRFYDDSIQCCGYSLWVLGFRKEFEELAHVQYHSLKKARTLVVGSPECAWTFKEVYPRIGLSFSSFIYSLPDYLAGFLRFLPFRAKAKTETKYFYHDACYQGRYLKQYEEPREILKRLIGFRPEEFAFNRAESLCSGAGGGYDLIRPEASQAITRRHLPEILDRGVRTMVSACPKAAHRFRSLGHKIVVKDWISFLNENLLPWMPEKDESE